MHQLQTNWARFQSLSKVRQKTTLAISAKRMPFAQRYDNLMRSLLFAITTHNVLQMMKIDRYKERIDHMLFKIEFVEKLRHLSENMNAVLDASTALKESKALKELLNVCCVTLLFPPFSDDC